MDKELTLFYVGVILISSWCKFNLHRFSDLVIIDINLMYLTDGDGPTGRTPKPWSDEQEWLHARPLVWGVNLINIMSLDFLTTSVYQVRNDMPTAGPNDKDEKYC